MCRKRHFVSFRRFLPIIEQHTRIAYQYVDTIFLRLELLHGAAHLRKFTNIGKQYFHICFLGLGLLYDFSPRLLCSVLGAAKHVQVGIFGGSVLGQFFADTAICACDDHALVRHVDTIGACLPDANTGAILHGGRVGLDVSEVAGLGEVSLPVQVPLRCADAGAHCAFEFGCERSNR